MDFNKFQKFAIQYAKIMCNRQNKTTQALYDFKTIESQTVELDTF